MNFFMFFSKLELRLSSLRVAATRYMAPLSSLMKWISGWRNNSTSMKSQTIVAVWGRFVTKLTKIDQ